MHKVPQFEPITRMQTKPTEVLALLDAGPVILAQRSKAAAVLISIEQWDKTVELIDDLTDTVDALRMELAIAKGEVEMMSQAEITEWLAEDERVPA